MDHERTSYSQVEKLNPLLCGERVHPNKEGCGKQECNWCYIPSLGSSNPKRSQLTRKSIGST